MDSGQGSAQTKQAKKSKKLSKVLLAVVLVASLAGNAFLVFEKLNTKQEKNMTGAVCGDDIIHKYNELYADSTTNNDKYSSLLKEIEAKENYKEDVNCAYLGYSIKISIGENPSEYFNLVKNKVYQGSSPSLKIKSRYSLEDMEESSKNFGDPGGRGGFVYEN